MPQRSVWQQMPGPVRNAIAAAIEARWLPARALASYSRWWQLETWLRSLAYVELRAKYGAEWVNQLDQRAVSRRTRDQRRAYMASPDWEDPLAYLDSTPLFDLIDREWPLFDPVLLDRDTWRGRTGELIDIRNRIGHLRRPHADDLGRLEQTLRDLESGAFRALSSYNDFETPDRQLDDPVVEAWVRDGHEDARRLVRHAETNYETTFNLSYSCRPWAVRPVAGQPVSGTEGVYWRAFFVTRGARINLLDFWRDGYWDIIARGLVAHLLIDGPGVVAVTFPAVDDSAAVCDAIGNVFDALLTNLSWYEMAQPWRPDYLDSLPALDFRVQVRSPWTIVDRTTTPITIFSA